VLHSRAIQRQVLQRRAIEQVLQRRAIKQVLQRRLLQHAIQPQALVVGQRVGQRNDGCHRRAVAVVVM